MVVTFHGQASGALSGCCAEPHLRPCRRWRTTPQLRLFLRPARPRCRDTSVGVAVAASFGRLARHLPFGRLVVASPRQRVCAALPCRSVALSVRCACHSVASSGAIFPGNCAYADSCATRWRRVRDVRATRWRRVVRYFLATAHMLTLVPLGGAECAMCVPLGGVEWCARDTARLRGHQRGRRHRRAARRPRTAGLPVKSKLWRCRAVPVVQGRIAHVPPISYKNFLFMLELQRQFARSSFIMDGASWKGEGRRPRGKGDPR